MKAAIIGAGVSGLSCAIELERHGIKPVIFEKRSHVSEALMYSAIWPRIINRPIQDPIKYINREYGIQLTPLSNIKRMVLFSPNKSAVQRGSLGYIFKRGAESYSLENQLIKYLNTHVTFNKYIEIEDIKDDYDYIIVASATSLIPKKLGVWTDTFNAVARVATVLGDFVPSEVIMWMNTKYAKNAFCYLVPNSTKEASLVQIVNGITSYEMDYYWKEFLFTENIDYNISLVIDTEHDNGLTIPMQLENILFVGNAGGFTNDLLGCGGLNAIESGMLAARAIIYGKDYNALVEPIFKDILQLHEYRRTMNAFDNLEFDRFIAILGIPVLKNTIYNNPFFRITKSAIYAKFYNMLAGGRRTSVK
ncbi:MAG: NAD(P)/FAD-dependent oxidoreductase [Caulobacteraceae bacterium]